MKKVLALLLVFFMAVCFCACGKEEDNVTNTAGDSVDQNTISLVNAAFDTTAESIENAEALGVEINYRRNLTYGEESQSTYIGLTYNYVGTGEDKQFFYEHETKSGDTGETAVMYSDGKNIYGFKADTTYLLVKDNLTADYINSIQSDISVFDTSDLEVIDTVILDTSSGGHAFVIKYKADDKGFDPKEAFGPLYAEGDLDLELTPISLSVSGTIDTEGRLIDETITYEYSYEYEDMSGVDPDNSEAKGTTKTATVKLVTAANFNHGLSSITAPSDITLLPEEGESEEDEEDEVEIKELSLTDFLKIGQQNDKDAKKK